MFEYILLMFMCLGSVLVLNVGNPVQSLLWLMLVFGLMSMEFIILGVEFLALLIFMVYMGAMAVLFLFVIMMLNIKFIELRFLYLSYISMSVILFFLVFFEMIYSFYFFGMNNFMDFFFVNWIFFVQFLGNIYILGTVLYSYWAIFFLLLALILLVSMMGSMVLVVNWGKGNNINLDSNMQSLSSSLWTFGS